MTKLHYIIVACTTGIMLSGCIATVGNSHQAVTYVQVGQLVTSPGEYMQLTVGCRVKLETAAMGGYSILSLGSKNVDTIHDVTGIAWATPNMLVYSVSPIYGKPGIYIYDCIGQASRQIVAPKNMNNAYPDGADYFELYGMDGSKILFYYTNDVDSLDFSEFRNRSLLFGVNLDGSNFVRFKNND